MESSRSVGIIGCGHISQTHLAAWAKTVGCEVRGLFDLNRELAEKRAAQFGVGPIYDTMETLIAHVDVVDVCTPPQTHSRIAQQVIEAGKHLLIEKPLVTDLTDWKRLKVAAEQSRGTITVVHNIKFLSSIQRAKRWVEEGRIGKIIRLEREFLTSPSTDRMLVGNRHWSHSLPGGRWFETLPHELYLTHFFVGPLELEHVTVLSTEQAPSGAAADEVLITLKGMGCIATIHFSANCEINRRTLTLIGTHGVITLDLLSDFLTIDTQRDSQWRRAAGRLILGSGQTLLRALPDRIAYMSRQAQKRSPHFNIIQAFTQHLQGLRETPTPLDEIDYVVQNSDRIGREIDHQLMKITS